MKRGDRIERNGKLYSVAWVTDDTIYCETIPDGIFARFKRDKADGGEHL